MKLDKYLEYANHVGVNEKVGYWLNSTLKNYLEKHDPKTEEVEHLIDYLSQNEIPKIQHMSYEDGVKKADKWTKKLQKQAEKIKELPEDTELVHDFKDGFKIVKLVGKNAYDREGYLMRNCVASYFGNGTEIYSLRDKNNNPHCTMEKDRQVKGKGNGDIHPKYISYVVKFLEITGMTVGDSEMSHLGYMNGEKIKKYLHKDTKYFNKTYLPENEKLIDKDGNEFTSLDLLDIKPLIKESVSGKLKINFELNSFIKLSLDFLFKRNKKDKLTQSSSGDSSQLASSGDSSKLASSGDSSKLASSGHFSKLASSGDSSKLASSGHSSQLASSGDYSKLASSGDSSKLASSGHFSQLASSGDSSKLASSGHFSQLEITGDKSVGANIGVQGIIKGKIGTWITLAEYDSNYNPICVKSAQIDGKKLKEDTWYKLENKKFKEVK